MDQVKAGRFLKELRKEKGLTQEQIAEEFNVSNRTVSRWENGNNMPDLSMLVELSEFYDVDIREIIDGERKSENMNDEMKDTLEKVADYTDTNKEIIINKLRNNSIITVILLAIPLVIEWCGISHNHGFIEFLQIACLYSAFILVIDSVMYATGKRDEMSKNRGKSKALKGIVVAIVICSLASLILVTLGVFW